MNLSFLPMPDYIDHGRWLSREAHSSPSCDRSYNDQRKKQIPHTRLEDPGEPLPTLSFAEDCQKGSDVLYFWGVGTAATKTVHKSTGTSSAQRSENRQREMMRCLGREGEAQQAWALQTFLHLSVTHSFLPGMGQNLPVQSEKGVTEFPFGHT